MQNDTLPEVQLGTLLREQGLTVATAESCTGGLIAHRLTNISGSSAYLMGGIISYSNEAKRQFLNVQAQTLISHGAVSEQTAAEMVIGVKAAFGVDCALSVTGIAGPGGGTAEKPVGLTYIGMLAPGLVTPVVEHHVWDAGREANKAFSADAALNLLLRHLSV